MPGFHIQQSKSEASGLPREKWGAHFNVKYQAFKGEGEAVGCPHSSRDVDGAEVALSRSNGHAASPPNLPSGLPPTCRRRSPIVAPPVAHPRLSSD